MKQYDSIPLFKSKCCLSLISKMTHDHGTACEVRCLRSVPPPSDAERDGVDIILRVLEPFMSGPPAGEQELGTSTATARVTEVDNDKPRKKGSSKVKKPVTTRAKVFQLDRDELVDLIRRVSGKWRVDQQYSYCAVAIRSHGGGVC
jgi:hypothetical protein